MPQPIARLYDNPTPATAAVDELRQRGFNADAVHLISPSTTGSIPDAITETGVSPEQAKIFAEGIARGEALVVVSPPFGGARTATDILDSHGPLETAIAAPEVVTSSSSFSFSFSSSSVEWGSATPLSSWLKWPVLLSDPAPLSSYMKWQTLKPPAEASPTLESVRKQSLEAAPLSSKIGMPALSDNASPLSDKLGWRTLLGSATPLSDKFGWSTLWDDPAPLSSKLGWSVLLDNPTPLSSKIGYDTLSKNP